MFKFLLKGIQRDKHRSLLPIIVVAFGVFISIVMAGWMRGIFTDMIDLNANFDSGHVKVMSQAYAENISQTPNDLAMFDAKALLSDIRTEYPDLDWVSRIQFGGLIDVPDEHGVTRAQGTAIGRAVDLLSPETKEIDRMNLRNSVVQGSLPSRQGEVLISEDFAQKFNVELGQEVTLFGSDMNGGMMFVNYTVCGTIRFGMPIMDRGALIIDIRDAEAAMDMTDAASEILGYFRSESYDQKSASALASSFNEKYTEADDEYSPVMLTMNEIGEMSSYIAMTDSMSSIVILVLLLAMTIVLWNTGLLGGLRRYSEYGLRLALGEQKSHIYRTVIIESIFIGLIGSTIGGVIGLGAVWLLSEYGLDVSRWTKDISMMIPSVYRAKFSFDLFFIGYIPGMIGMVLGTALAGRGIYKRSTANLFKELEV